MKAYLAAAWGRRLEILEVAHKLESVGVNVTSHWLTEESGQPLGNRERADVDLADVDRADTLVRFTDPEFFEETWVERRLLSGARMVEMGYALAKGKRVIVVGGKQNVFDWLGNVTHVADVDELVRLLLQEG
jgi:nucleoside 2-deoxyribosyltransferase